MTRLYPLFILLHHGLQVLASRLKHDGSASSIDDTSELVLDSPLPSTSDDDEYVS